jgi:hypothetical protein
VTDSENLDLVRSIHADWARCDFSEFGWAHAEFEWIIADGPRAGSFKEVGGAEESLYGMLEAWDEWRFEAEEYRELDGGRVLALARTSGAQGRTSGIHINEVGGWRHAALFEFRHANVTRLVVYVDRDRALADLGLEE